MKDMRSKHHPSPLPGPCSTYGRGLREVIHLVVHVHGVCDGRVAEHGALAFRWEGGLVPDDEDAVVGNRLLSESDLRVRRQTRH